MAFLISFVVGLHILLLASIAASLATLADSVKGAVYLEASRQLAKKERPSR